MTLNSDDLSCSAVKLLGPEGIKMHLLAATYVERTQFFEFPAYTLLARARPIPPALLVFGTWKHKQLLEERASHAEPHPGPLVRSLSVKSTR